jgi:hypothetical protein
VRKFTEERFSQLNLVDSRAVPASRERMSGSEADKEPPTDESDLAQGLPSKKEHPV